VNARLQAKRLSGNSRDTMLNSAASRRKQAPIPPGSVRTLAMPAQGTSCLGRPVRTREEPAGGSVNESSDAAFRRRSRRGRVPARRVEAEGAAASERLGHEQAVGDLGVAHHRARLEAGNLDLRARKMSATIYAPDVRLMCTPAPPGMPLAPDATSTRSGRLPSR